MPLWLVGEINGPFGLGESTWNMWFSHLSACSVVLGAFSDVECSWGSLAPHPWLDGKVLSTSISQVVRIAQFTSWGMWWAILFLFWGGAEANTRHPNSD
jgi:hypothetical protein